VCGMGLWGFIYYRLHGGPPSRLEGALAKSEIRLRATAEGLGCSHAPSHERSREFEG